MKKIRLEDLYSVNPINEDKILIRILVAQPFEQSIFYTKEMIVKNGYIEFEED